MKTGPVQYQTDTVPVVDGKCVSCHNEIANPRTANQDVYKCGLCGFEGCAAHGKYVYGESEALGTEEILDEIHTGCGGSYRPKNDYHKIHRDRPWNRPSSNSSN